MPFVLESYAPARSERGHRWVTILSCFLSQVNPSIFIPFLRSRYPLIVFQSDISIHIPCPQTPSHGCQFHCDSRVCIDCALMPKCGIMLLGSSQAWQVNCSAPLGCASHHDLGRQICSGKLHYLIAYTWNCLEGERTVIARFGRNR